LADWGTSTLSEIIHDMPFVDPPDRKSLELAERFLLEIGALGKKDNDRFILTDLGRRISKMPCHPRLAAAISQAMNQKEQRDATYLAGSIVAAYCLDNESSSQAMAGRRNNDDPNLVYIIESVLQDSFKFSALLRFAGRVAGAEGMNAVQELNNDKDFMRKTFFNLGKALLPGFIDLVAERRGDASYESSNYFLAVGLPYAYEWITACPSSFNSFLIFSF
jgi:HrpA-like RNA helicase